MITYELALKLKEEGFPQGMDNFVDPDNTICTVDYTCKESIYCPTLSNLIKACGDKFYELVKCVSGPKVTFSWFAISITLKVFGTGLSPEEAIANLWLELNKK